LTVTAFVDEFNTFMSYATVVS